MSQRFLFMMDRYHTKATNRAQAALIKKITATYNVIVKRVTRVELDGFDEIPYCRKCCRKWAECKGQQIRICNFIKTILGIQEKKQNILYTLAGQPITIGKK